MGVHLTVHRVHHQPARNTRGKSRSAPRGACRHRAKPPCRSRRRYRVRRCRPATMPDRCAGPAAARAVFQHDPAPAQRLERERPDELGGGMRLTPARRRPWRGRAAPARRPCRQRSTPRRIRRPASGFDDSAAQCVVSSVVHAWTRTAVISLWRRPRPRNVRSGSRDRQSRGESRLSFTKSVEGHGGEPPVYDARPPPRMASDVSVPMAVGDPGETWGQAPRRSPARAWCDGTAHEHAPGVASIVVAVPS